MKIHQFVNAQCISHVHEALAFLPKNSNSLLASSCNPVGLVLWISASILACSIPSSTNVGIVTPSRSVWLCLEGTLCSGILHVVQVSFGAISVCFLIVESIESHLLTRPLEMNDITRADLHHKSEKVETFAHEMTMDVQSDIDRPQQPKFPPQKKVCNTTASTKPPRTFMIFFFASSILCPLLGTFAFTVFFVHRRLICLASALCARSATSVTATRRVSLTNFNIRLFKYSDQIRNV